MICLRRIFIALVLLVAATRPARAHDLAPAYLELTQTDPTHISMLWKVPAHSVAQESLTPRLPEDFRIIRREEPYRSGDNLVERFTLECPPSAAPLKANATALDGQTIAIDGLDTTLADVIVRIVKPDGSASVTRLNPAQTHFTVEAQPGALHLAAVYTRLGIEHILMGVDHLLFVLGLMLVVKNRWMLFKTITSFTVAHSITLAIATLGYASAPLPPLNAAIALSILFLGPEIVRARRGQTSLTLRHPWIVAFAFGLLHGFGFASGLTSLGLTGEEIPLALLLFNVGVEIGQLLFVFVILGLARSFEILEVRWPRWVTWLPAYTVGGLGAYWTIQRTLMLLGIA